MEDIKEFTNNTIFIRAYKVYKSNKIKNLKAKKVSDNGEIAYKISADINSSSLDEEYFTEFYLGEKGITKYYCSCPTFFNYDGPCKHIVSLLIAFHYKPEKVIELQNRKVLDRLINNIKAGNKNITSIKYEVLMDITLCVEYNSGKPVYSLEIAVGEQQKYVVKNMKKFIYCIMKKKALEFGSNFTLSNIYHIFNEEDFKIINVLQELYEFNEINKNQVDYNHKSFLFKGKKVYLPTSHIKKVLEILEIREFNIRYLEQEQIKGEIVNEDLPLEFTISNVENTIVIEQLGDLPLIFTEDNKYFFYNKIIYKPSELQIEIYLGFLEAFKNNKKIIFEYHYLNDMYKFIMPAIKKICKQVYIDDKVKSDFINTI
jgi:predicted nucleic acid-binding Zn finger protein